MSKYWYGIAFAMATLFASNSIAQETQPVPRDRKLDRVRECEFNEQIDPLSRNEPGEEAGREALDAPPPTEHDSDLPLEADEQAAEFPNVKTKKTRGFGGGPGMGTPGYGATWYASQPVSGTTDRLGFVRQSLNGAAPIWRQEGDVVLLNGAIKHSLFFTDAILPDSGDPFPEELWNINLGLSHLHEFANGWSSMLSVSMGSASDQPFNSIEEMNVNLLAALQVPTRNQRDQWMFSLMYSPVGVMNFPIPGVAYSWNPSDSFAMNIGLPFSIHWKPTDRTSLKVSYVPLTNVNARVIYQWSESVALYGGFEWLNEGYLLADRLDKTDRFVGFEKRLISGLQWDFAPSLRLDLHGGYSFDRYFGEGNSGFAISNLRDRVDIAPTAFAGAQLGLRW